MKRALFFTVLLVVCAPAFADVNIVWAQGALAQNDANGDRAKTVTGAPDGNGTAISDNAFLYVFDFNFHKNQRTLPVPYKNLARLLGLTEDQLTQYDVIAFEGNGNQTPGGWESAIWLLTDQKHAAAGSFPADAQSRTSPLKFLSGTITRAQFVSYFHPTLPPDRLAEYESWILIKLPPEIKPDAQEFRIWICGALVGANTNPDPDAFGVIRH